MGDYIVESKEEAIKMLRMVSQEGLMIKGNLKYALAEGIIALEKQIPKKPEHLIAKEDTRIGAGLWRKGTKITKCICGSFISRGNYCHHCGQKIDWEG